MRLWRGPRSMDADFFHPAIANRWAAIGRFSGVELAPYNARTAYFRSNRDRKVTVEGTALWPAQPQWLVARFKKFAVFSAFRTELRFGVGVFGFVESEESPFVLSPIGRLSRRPN